MRVISGSAGRRKIKVPKTVLRPTTDRAREAIFSLLGDLVVDANCLDLFAGSGALGLEALSRGAQSCTFIDSDPLSIRAIRENLAALDLKGNVRQADASALYGLPEASFDLVFADPPYAKNAKDRDFLRELLDGKLHQLLRANAYFVAEAPAGRVAEPSSNWQIVTERSYGSCGVTVYQAQS